MKKEITIEKVLEKRRKEYEQTLSESEMLSKMLMSKDKKELVGMIIGMIMTGSLKQ